jgi:hypothetical protein
MSWRGDDSYPAVADRKALSVSYKLIDASNSPFVVTGDSTAGLSFQFAHAARVIPVMVRDENHPKVEILLFQNSQDRRRTAGIDCQTIVHAVPVQVDQVVPECGNSDYRFHSSLIIPQDPIKWKCIDGVAPADYNPLIMVIGG